MINPDLLAEHIATKGYYVLEQALPHHHFHALSTHIKSIEQQDQLASAKIGSNTNLHKNPTIRRDKTLWLNEHSEDPSIQAYFNFTTQISQALNQTLFLSLREFETHFAVYPPGAYYQKHIDQFATNKDRKISCVYYLNQEWQATHGGELKLYNQHNELIETLLPMGNRFICFNSELPHEVCLTHQTRYSIAGWMKTLKHFV